MNETNVLVSGTCRCGSSLVMNILTKAGLNTTHKDLPFIKFTEYNKQIHNPDGYFEIHKIHSNEFNLLNENKVNWYGKKKSGDSCIPLESNDQYLNNLCEILKILPQPWAIKINTIALSLPLWDKILKKLGIKYMVVWCYRHPQSVLKSILNKNNWRREEIIKNIPPEYWRNHNVAFMKNVYNVKCSVVVVNYHKLVQDPKKNYQEFINSLQELSVPVVKDNEKVIEKKLSHYPEIDVWKSPSEKYIWNILENWNGKIPTRILNISLSFKNKIKPNNKCPCKSGKKYKKCCKF